MPIVPCWRPPRVPRRDADVSLLRTVLMVGLVGLAPPAMALTLPPWIQSQLTVPIPQHEAKTVAVLLYSDTTLAVQPNGKIQRSERQVIKILRPEGLDYGVVSAHSNTQIRILSMHGWNIAAGSPPADVGDRDAIESSVIGVPEGNLVDDVRSKLLRIPAVVTGNIVATEVVQEIQPYILADDWVFQSEIPVRETHLSLDLPKGWNYKVHWINHEAVPPTTSGGRSQWALTDLKAIREEEQMPPWEAVSGRLAISFVPPGGRGQGFESWADVGAWYLNLTQGRQASNPAIKQQVATLTAAQPTPLAKIQALATFVQSDVRYVAIELGIGGYQPHAAVDVFAHRYGDCKDKATLLAAMLKEIGIDANYVIVNTERGAVSDATPPNLGFNHVILAIRLPAGIEDPSLLAVSNHARLGRLLFFDPTDTYTPLGSLEGPLQASFGLLVTADGGELVHLPSLPVTSSSLKRTAHLTIDDTGTLSGQVDEVSTGDAAALARAQMDATTVSTDQIKPVESLMAASFPTFTLKTAAVRNLRTHDRPFEWHFAFEVPGFAESSGNLITLRPRILGTKSTGLLETKAPRENDIEFEGPRMDTDEFEIALPQGYIVDDMPQPLNLDYPYAAYHSKTEISGHTLKYTRTFVIKQVMVPSTQAPQLKDFFRAILNEEAAVAVLRRASANHGDP